MLARLKLDAGPRIPRGTHHETQRHIDRHTHTHTIHNGLQKPRFHTHNLPPASEPNLQPLVRTQQKTAAVQQLAAVASGVAVPSVAGAFVESSLQTIYRSVQTSYRFDHI